MGTEDCSREGASSFIHLQDQSFPAQAPLPEVDQQADTAPGAFHAVEDLRRIDRAQYALRLDLHDNLAHMEIRHVV